MVEWLSEFNKHIQIYAKDKNSKYLFCNEAVAEAAGVDSPHQMIGKTDHDFVWKSYVDVYHKDDADVLKGSSLVNAIRPQPQFKRVATMLNTKVIMVNKNGYPIGVTGHTIDITGYTFRKNNGRINREKNIFYLGNYFGNDYLTRREFQIFKYLLLGKSTEEIALLLSRSMKTIQSQIKSITNKLQCSHKSEIVPTAIKHGLTYILDELVLEKN